MLSCVNTPKPEPKHWPEREDFFIWFDDQKKRAKVPHDSVVARLAGLDASSVSSWRSGRQRPNTASLKAIAEFFGVTAQEAWAKAGRLATADVAENPALEDRAIQIIRGSKLSKAAKDMLITQHLEERRAAEAKLQQTIGMLEGAQAK